MDKLFAVGVEEYASSTTIHYHTSSSAPLKRIFTNDVHPIYLAGNTKSPCLPPDLRNKIDKNLANFYGTDVAEADVTAAVPRGLLRSLLTEQFVVHSDYTTTLPAISPHSARTFFSDILFQNAVTELSKEEESPFHDVFDKLVHSDCADPKRISMRNNIFLPFELPAAPIKPVKGALLHTYFVGTDVFVIHATGSSMDDLAVCFYDAEARSLERCGTLQLSKNFNSDIEQIEIRYTNIDKADEFQRVVVRTANHVTILEITDYDPCKFRILESLLIPKQPVNVSICKFTGAVTIISGKGNILLWEPDKPLRVLREAMFRPDAYYSDVYLAVSSEQTIPLKGGNKFSAFSAHPQTVLYAEDELLLSLDYRGPLTYSTPVHSFNMHAKYNQIVSLKYDPLQPFQFTVNTGNSAFLFDERYTARPVITWDILHPNEPSFHSTFVEGSATLDDFKNNFIFTYSNYGKMLLLPVKPPVRSWKTSSQFYKENAYLIPSFNVNDKNTYRGFIRNPTLPASYLAALRYDPELHVVGAGAFWYNSSSVDAAKSQDELCVVQLSTFGDVYVEHFKFNIAPSILDKPLPLWYDRQTHNDESIVLKRIPFFPEPEKKDYALHSVVPILNRLLIQSYDWYKPKDVDEFIVQSGLSQYAPPQANPLSFEQLPSIFAKIKHQLDLMKMLENPISLMEIAFSIRHKTKQRLVNIKELFYFLLHQSALLKSQDFPFKGLGKQEKYWKKNPLFRRLEGYLTEHPAEKPVFYIFPTCLFTPSLAEEDEFYKGVVPEYDNQFFDREYIGTDPVFSSAVYPFAINFCTITGWDELQVTIEKKKEKVSTLQEKKKESKKLPPRFHIPGEFRNSADTGSRSKHYGNHLYAKGIRKKQLRSTVELADTYELDLADLESKWNATSLQTAEKRTNNFPNLMKQAGVFEKEKNNKQKNKPAVDKSKWSSLGSLDSQKASQEDILATLAMLEESEESEESESSSSA